MDILTLMKGCGATEIYDFVVAPTSIARLDRTSPSELA